MAAPVVLACTATLAATAPAQAVGGFHTSAASVRVRSVPSTANNNPIAIIGAAGAGIDINCQLQGETVTAAGFGTSWVWDKLNGYNGYISDLFVQETAYAQFDSRIPQCPTAPAPPPPAADVTAQMRNAANWAIAEKNSPNPAWSDNLRHYWSGWCEAFARQAEGFPTMSFGSAMAHYNWQKSQGRIHTDTNAPVGAVVFWNTSAAGHVAISIGGGQAVGTQGYMESQRLPVAQYPLSRFPNYLGWARPVGS